ncbi:MAG: amino acid racemase [Candidatus Aminicenantes bacterium]|nr:amino acid racemase [Candidatus Aminicenantes bacterium]
MKTIGMIGGMSWESSLEYYRILNQTVKQELGGFHSAKCVMFSVDFEEIEQLQHKGEWGKLTDIMVLAAQKVEKAGADCILICTNTMHKMAPEVEASINIPLLHIADVTAKQIKSKGQKKVGLLGTKFTMEQEFYKGRLEKDHGIEVMVPDPDQRTIIHNILYQELVKGEITEKSKNEFKVIIESLNKRGAQGIILGCTEIPLLVKQTDYQIELYDTTFIHAQAAVQWALHE